MMFGRNGEVQETIKRIPKSSIGVELGVWKGVSSELFSKKTSTLHLVDSWSVEPYTELESYESYLDRYSKLTGGSTPDDFMRFYDKVHAGVVNKFKNNKNVKVYRMTTDRFFETFDQDVDWFYVDAAHDEAGVYRDMTNCYNYLKSRRGGIIFGDDYGVKLGVVAGVDKFMKNNTNLVFDNFYGNQFEVRVDI